MKGTNTSALASDAQAALLRVTIHKTTVLSIRCVALVLFALLVSLATDARGVTMQWSFVGNPGNFNDAADGDAGGIGIQNYGAVPYVYNIGTKDVTASQYAEFLNAKDPTGINTLHLYNTDMSYAPYGGINFNSLNPAGTKYSVIAGRGDHPVNYVSWYDAIRFANWLNNGQGSGSTETGAYTLGTLDPGGTPVTPPLTHNAGALVWLPTENEWYKAAYYDPRTTAQGGPPFDSHYWLYGTGTPSPFTPTASGPTSLGNHANFNNAVGNLTDVGAYTGTTSPSGAFDMAGNVSQWTEALSAGFRVLRGGGFSSDPAYLQSMVRGRFGATDGALDLGFRVASVAPVPEPSTLALAALGLIGFASLRWRLKR